MTPEQLIKATKQLIAIRSTSDNPTALQEAVDFIANLIHKRCPDITVERFEQNGKSSLLAYQGKTRPTRFDILLNGHVDVVPAKPEQFKAYIKDGKLYGRGALDMKGTAVALADAFCEAINDVPYALGLQIVSDEEVGGYDGTRAHLNAGVRADFVMIGEYSNHPNTIYNAARGLCWAEIVFEGKTAHGGHLWHGSNAVVKASDFATAVLARYPTPEEEAWTTTASISSMSTPNETYNKVPDRAILKIDFRFTQEDPTFASEASIRAFIASIDPDAELVDMATFEPAVHVAESHPYVQGLSKALRHVTGKETNFMSRPAGSDGRHYALFDADIIEFGLYGQGSHSDREWVEISSFASYQATMREFLHNPCIEAQQPDPIIISDEPLHETLLRKLVAMPTFSDDTTANQQALDYVQRFLAARGMHCERHTFDTHGVLLASTRPSNMMQPHTLLTAHMDVARSQPEQFDLRLEDGIFYGRGVYDMKGAIASYMALVDKLQDNITAYDFAILITTDEEYGSQNGINGSSRILELGCRPKVCIMPDSAAPGWDIEAFVKGPWRFELIANGQAAHGSRPWDGESAIDKLIHALHEIRTHFADQNHHTDTVNIGVIHGGTEFNEVAIDARASVEMRLLNQASLKKYRKYIDELCKRHGLSYAQRTLIEPLAHDLTDPYIQAFMQSIEAVTGHTPKGITSLGASDAENFVKYNVPCILTCPNGGGHHGDHEWVDRTQLAQLVPILEHFLLHHASTAKQQRS